MISLLYLLDKNRNNYTLKDVIEEGPEDIVNIENMDNITDSIDKFNLL